ncbi:MAG: hypothetical protein V4543_14955, partial [Bacteroidota bacterium]
MKMFLHSLRAVLLLSVLSSQSALLIAASAPKHLEVKGNSNSTGINAMPKRAATTCRTPYIRQSGPAAFCEGGSVTLSAPGSGTVVLDQLNSQGELHQYDKAGNYYYGSRQEVNSMYALDVFIWKESPNGERRAFAGALDLFPLSSTPGYTVANTGGLIVNFTIDNNGNLIVLNDGCKLKKITPAGVVTDLFPANSYCRSYYTNKGMTVDPTGNIYFTDYYGSGITKVDASTGIKSLFAGSSTEQGYADGAGTAARFSAIRDIVSDNAGNIYATDEYVVRKISPAGVVSTFYGTPDYFGNPDFHFGTDGDYGGAPGLVGLDGIDIDASGNIYLTAMSSVIKINPDSIGYGYGNGALSGGFSPIDFTVSPSGNILAFTDIFNYGLVRVSVWDTVDSYIWSTSATSRNISATASGSYTVKTVYAGCTSEPSDAIVVTVSTIPTLPVVTAGGSTNISCEGQSVTLTSSSAAAYLWNTGATTQSITVSSVGYYSVKSVSGTCTTGSSNVIIVTGKRMATPIIYNGTAVTFCSGGSGILYAQTPLVKPSLYAGQYYDGFSDPIYYRDGKASAARFYRPGLIATDKQGNIYVHDQQNQYLRRISRDSVVSSVAALVRADGLVTDSAGNVFVSQNNQILKITPAGTTAVFAGSSVAGFANGIGTSARFTELGTMTIDRNDNLYVWDKGNFCIRKISASGMVSFFAGGDSYGTADGNNISARFSNITGLTVDSSDNIFALDESNEGAVIRKILFDGTVSTIRVTYDGDLTENITIRNAGNIGLDRQGYFYLACGSAYNACILKVSPSGRADTVADTYSFYNIFNFNNSSGATLELIGGMVVDRVGSIYYSDNAANTINRLVIPVNPESYLWSNGSTDKDLVVTSSGSYTLQTIAAGCTTAASNAIVITVASPATPTISSSGSTALCPAGSVTLTSSSATNNHWSTGATTQSISVSAAGSYTVYYTSGTCTSATSSATTVTLNSATSAAGSITGSTTTAQGNTESYSISSVAGATGYTWSYSGSDVTITGSGTTVSLEFGLAATSGTLRVYGTGSCGNGAPADLEITVGSAAITDLSVSGSQGIGGTYNNVVISGMPVVSLSADLVIYGNIVIPNGATFNTGCHTVSGPGSFTLEAGANLVICNTDGIAQTGSTGAVRTNTRNFSDDANYEYNGLSSQVTGNGLPSKVRNLTAGNANALVLSQATSVSNTLTLSRGTFNLGGKKLSLLSTPTQTARLAEIDPGAAFANASAFEVQRWLSPAAVRTDIQASGAYYWLGAPVGGQTVNAWNTAANPYVTTSYDGGNHYGSVWLYDNSNNTTPANGGWVKPADAGTSLSPGTGAHVWFGNAFFAGGATASLISTPAYGNVSLPVSYCDGSCAGNSTNNGWNFVANPYASSIDWNDADWTKTNMADAIYVWRNRETAYSSYVDGVGTVGGSNLIASGQGFMVKATDASPVLTAKEGVKTASAVSA